MLEAPAFFPDSIDCRTVLAYYQVKGVVSYSFEHMPDLVLLVHARIDLTAESQNVVDVGDVRLGRRLGTGGKFTFCA